MPAIEVLLEEKVEQVDRVWLLERARHHDPSASPRRGQAIVHRSGDSNAFDGQVAAETAGDLSDLDGGNWRWIDRVMRADLDRELASGLGRFRDDDPARAFVLGGKDGQESDWASTGDEHRLAGIHVAPAQRVNGDAQRFRERRALEPGVVR